MKSENMQLLETEREDDVARQFCAEFIAGKRPRYVLGRNEYAESILAKLDIDGVVDDYTSDSYYQGVPIIKMSDLSEECQVVSVVIGRPITALERLHRFTPRALDYFSFVRYADLDVKPVKFWPQFRKDFDVNHDQYKMIFNLLSDEASRKAFMDIIHFRYYSDLSYMKGYTDKQASQYFEPFLPLRQEGEIFADIGGFDGMTTLEFIKRHPGYDAVYFFEPDSKNVEEAKKRLKNFKNITYIEKGLSNKHEFLQFTSDGSTSKVSDEGDVTIEVDRLDALLQYKITFLKMDIEGGEHAAIEGGVQLIREHGPILALCVYHLFDDLWKIPQRIFAIRNDYHLYLRHYTEGVDETVMFFIPESRIAAA